MGSSSRSSGRCPAGSPRARASSISRASSPGAAFRYREAPAGAPIAAPRRRCDEELQRPQEVQQILLVAVAETVVVVDDPIGLGRTKLRVAAALVRLDRYLEIVRAAVVQEEDALAEAPQRRRA